MNLTTASIEPKGSRGLLPFAGLLVGGAAVALAITAIATDDVGTEAPAPAVVAEQPAEPANPAPPAAAPAADELVFACEPQRIVPVPC